MNFLEKYKIPLFLFVLTSAVYSIRIQNLSMWGDEISTLNFTESIEKATLDRFHPPLYYLLLCLFRQLFGHEELVLRLFSVFFAAAGVFVTYLCAMELSGNNKKLSLIASLLVATSPSLLLYSRMVRYFSMLFFSGTLVNYFFLKILNNREKTINFVYYCTASAFLIYTDYLAGVILLVHFFYLLFLALKKERFPFRKIFLFWLFTLLISLPVLVRLASAILSQEGNIFIHETQGTLKAFIFKIAYQYSSLMIGETMTISAAICLPLVIFAVVALLMKREAESVNHHRLLLLFFLLSVPILISLITNLFVMKLPVTHVTKLTLYLVPIYYLFILREANGNILTKTAVAVLFATNLYGSMNYFLGREFQNPNFATPWREIAEKVAVETDEETSLIVRDNNSAFLHYYRGRGRIFNMVKIEELKKLDLGKRAILVTRNTGSENLREIEKISKYLNERGRLEKAYHYLPLNSVERKLKESFLNIPLPRYYIDLLVFSFGT